MAGPPPMINAAKELFNQQGLPDAQLFSDAFDYSLDSQKNKK
jgi:CDP-4-dehydro-6-deoxyglucose reductase